MSDRSRRTSGGAGGGGDTSGSEGGRKMESDLRKYSEGAEDYEDVFGKGQGHGESRTTRRNFGSFFLLTAC